MFGIGSVFRNTTIFTSRERWLRVSCSANHPKRILSRPELYAQLDAQLVLRKRLNISSVRDQLWSIGRRLI
jgi:hypothetical protein